MWPRTPALRGTPPSPRVGFEGSQASQSWDTQMRVGWSELREKDTDLSPGPPTPPRVSSLPKGQPWHFSGPSVPGLSLPSSSPSLLVSFHLFLWIANGVWSPGPRPGKGKEKFLPSGCLIWLSGSRFSGKILLILYLICLQTP